MPRYYFHIHNSLEVQDTEGVDLSDLGAARQSAIRGAREMISEEIKDSGQIYLSHWLEIEDEHGTKTPVRFGDCIEVNP